MPSSPDLSSFATETSWILSSPRPTGVSNTSARSPTSSPGGPSSTCWRIRAAPSTPFACSSHQLSSVAATESFAGVPTKKRNIRAKRSSSIAWKRASPRTNTPQQNGVSERVGRTLCSMVRCFLVDSGFPPKLWGELMLTAPYLCNRMPHSGLDIARRRSSGYTARRPTCLISRSSALELSSASRIPRS